MKTNTHRPNYNQKRNFKIFEEFINGSSYNKLAKKYNISTQRAQAIVKDVINKITKAGLTDNATETDRNRLRSLAIYYITKREPLKAIPLLEQCANWDLTHQTKDSKPDNNYRGLEEIYGNLATCYIILGDQTSTKKNKIKNYNIAEDYLNKGIKLHKDHDDLPEGAKVTAQAHLASLMARKAINLEPKDRDKILIEARDLINTVILTLPGSHAHKAWPMNIKAKTLLALGDYNEAFDTVLEAEKLLFEYYDEEINWATMEGKSVIGNDQAEVKIKTWLQMLQETKKLITDASNKSAMCEVYSMLNK